MEISLGFSQVSLQKLAWFLFLFGFWVGGSTSAQSEPPVNGLDVLRTQFTSLSSIDIVGTYSCISYDPSISDPSKNPYEKVTAHFREQADRYWFEAKEAFGTHKILPQSMLWVFNGTESQLYDTTGLLSIKKGPLSDITYAAISFHPLASYIPFYPYARTQTKGYLPKLTEYKDPAIYQQSVANLKLAPQSFWPQKDVISYECKAEGEGRTYKNADLKIGLDPHHGYAPVIWERWSGGKRVILSEVVELAEFDIPGGGKFYFPKKSKFCWLKPDGISPVNEIDFELSSMTIGKLYTDDDFTLDPGMANLIFDVDANKVIKIPR